MARTRDGFHYTFIHNVFGAFIEDTLDYFAEYLYPRTAHRVVGTYDKAVEYLKDKFEAGREGDKPNLPAMILNPSGEFNLDDANSGARQLWRTPNLLSGFSTRIFTPIYQDANTKITVGFTRLKGDMELLILVNSFYEYFDVKLLMIQIFGGEGRIIEPVRFNSFIIIPEELKDFEYNNDATGVHYSLDWDGAGAYDHLVRTTNRNELVVAGKIKPRYILRGMSDASARHGGLDSLADWRLSLNIEYEIEIPSFIIIDSDYLAKMSNMNFGYGHTYSENSEFNQVPDTKVGATTEWDSGLEDGVNSVDGPILPDEVDSITRTEKTFKTRYFHELTPAEIDSTTNLVITLPEVISDPDLLTLQTKYGRLSYKDDYDIIDNGNTLLVYPTSILNLIAGDYLELFVYERLV